MTGAGVVPCHWRNSAQAGPHLAGGRQLSTTSAFLVYVRVRNRIRRE
jgi:hypothetical protein